MVTLRCTLYREWVSMKFFFFFTNVQKIVCSTGIWDFFCKKCRSSQFFCCKLLKISFLFSLKKWLFLNRYFFQKKAPPKKKKKFRCIVQWPNILFILPFLKKYRFHIEYYSEIRYAPKFSNAIIHCCALGVWGGNGSRVEKCGKSWF